MIDNTLQTVWRLCQKARGPDRPNHYLALLKNAGEVNNHPIVKKAILRNVTQIMGRQKVEEKANG